jgi:hypothetical protein
MYDEIELAVRSDLESLEKMDRTALRLRAVKLAEESRAVPSGDDDLSRAEAKVLAAAIEYAKAPKTHPTGWEDDADSLVPDGPVDMEQLCLRVVHMNCAYECQQKCGFEPEDRDPGDDKELLAEANLISAALEYTRVCNNETQAAKRAKV